MHYSLATFVIRGEIPVSVAKTSRISGLKRGRETTKRRGRADLPLRDGVVFAKDLRFGGPGGAGDDNAVKAA
jgi:hypothetical protein